MVEKLTSHYQTRDFFTWCWTIVKTLLIRAQVYPATEQHLCDQKNWCIYIHSAIYSAGAHTNHIKGLWAAAKRFLRGKPIHSKDQLQDWLNVYMWRRWVGKRSDQNIFHYFLREVTSLYKLWACFMVWINLYATCIPGNCDCMKNIQNIYDGMRPWQNV